MLWGVTRAISAFAARLGALAPFVPRTVPRAALSAAALLMVALPVAACSTEGGYAFELPEGFPEPRVPEDNPMSEAKVELGVNNGGVDFDAWLSAHFAQVQPEGATTPRVDHFEVRY